ncbi:cupin domain-containing protein [Chloroflexota bacterium]
MEERQTRMGGRQVYDDWMEKEGIPVYQAMNSVEDVTELPRRPWARTGGLGTFIQLEATKVARAELYVLEIPAGRALEPEKHLYDEILYVLRGRGLAEVWHEGQGKVTFEWAEGSLFAIPLNAWHRLVNGGREPVLIFGQSGAPLMMNSLRNTEFVFNCPYSFTDRFTGETDYFVAGKERDREGGGSTWETNFVPDVRTCFLSDNPAKVESGRLTPFIMAATAFGDVHSSEWPAGIYHKGHFHGPGAVLLGLKGEGYVLLWPRQYGIHPYQDGHGDGVIKVPWKQHSIYAPQNEWFHQHFNTGREPARHLALKGGGLGTELPTLRKGVINGVLTSVREAGGWLIEYEDEDPEIRRMFQEELRQKGVEFAMKPVVYRTDSFKLSR